MAPPSAKKGGKKDAAAGRVAKKVAKKPAKKAAAPKKKKAAKKGTPAKGPKSLGSPATHNLEGKLVPTARQNLVDYKLYGQLVREIAIREAALHTVGVEWSSVAEHMEAMMMGFDQVPAEPADLLQRFTREQLIS